MGLSLRKLGSKIFDQVNPFDNGRTYQQRTPTNNRSVVQQAVNSGASNVAQGVARNAVRAYPQAVKSVGRVIAPVTPVDDIVRGVGNLSEEVANAVPEISPTSPARFLNSLAIRPYKTTQGNFGQALQGQNPYEGSARQQAGQFTQDVINASSVLPVGKAASLATKGAPLGIKVLQGAKLGAKMGGGFGAAQGVSTSLQDELSIPEALKTTAVNTVAGTALGAGLGVAAPVGGKVISVGAKGALKGAKVSAKATQDAIQAVRNPLKPLNETGAVGRNVNDPLDSLRQEASKYKSAEEFVKAQTNLYHGTKADFSEFDPNLLGTNTGAPSAKKGFFFTDNEQLANHYANPGRNQGTAISKNLEDAMGRAVERAKKEGLDNSLSNNTGGAMVVGSWPKTAKATEVKSSILSKMETLKSRFDSPEDIKKINRFQQLVTEELDNTKLTDLELSGKVLKSKVNLENPMVFDDNGLRNGASYAKRIDEAIAKGHDGVIIKNTQDPFRGDIHVAFDKNQILTEKQLTDLYNQAQPTKNKLGLKKLNEGGYAKIPKASQLPKVALKQETAPQAPVPENNLVDSLPNNNIADNTKVPLQVTNKDTLLGELKTAMVDKDAPILDYLKGVEKETGQTGLVKQFMYDTGLQRRSSSIANAMMDNSDNLSAAFRGLVGKEKKAFDGYVGARREIQYTKDGLQTSAPVEELQGVVSAGLRFDDRYNALNGYYKEWAGRLHQAGILDDATYKSFTDSGEYTRVQRVMDDLAGFRGSGGNSYSLGTTMTKQKRKGSQRDIQPADLTAMKYAQDSQTEIQRNQTSSNLIDVLASQGHARQVENTTSKNTLSRIVDGKTEIWEVPRDIKEVADNVSPYQLGILSRIIAFPQRLLRAGATGLSAPFTTANYAKDQVSSAAMSENVKVTHQPKNVFNGLYQAAKDFGVGTDDPTWQKFLENLGDTTQYDFLRNQKSAKQFSRELRLGQGGRAINKGLHPIRTVEDLVQITEKATRFQNFKGTYEKALADGVPEAEALQKATLAAWQNSVDFSRMGSVGQVANLLIPYFNAGIQGTRLLVRRTGEAPLATSSKIISFVGLPLAAATFYNMEDEGRKKVYDNISDFEKQNNIIIVLPGAEQHEDGSYSGVVKIPLQPGMSNTVQPLRMAIENYAHDNPQDVLAMSKQFLGAVAGPINTNSISSAVGGLIPQVAKPMVQQVANNDFFTQKQIVPDFIQKATDANGNPVKETDKAYPYTSGTARIIGNATGQSPIRVEKFIKDTSAKVGQYTMNATDNALAKAGIIPDEQIGGISVKEDFARRFAVAQGKENTKKSEGARHYDDVNKETATLNGNELAAFNALHPNKKNFLGDTITDMDSVYNSAARLDAYNRYPKVFEVDKRLDAKGRKAGNPGNPLYDLEQWQVKKVLEKENLPPGASDKELSKLHEQDWYNDYSTKKSKFFTDIKNKSASDLETAKAKGDTKKVKALEASITKFNSSDNPYPVTSPDLQKQMDYYSSLPKGTGARKSWIQSNPGLYKQMQDQYAKIDNWQNVQRGKRGLDTTEGVAGANAGYDTGSSSGGYSKGGSKGGGSGGGGSSSPEVESAYKYAIKLKSSGGIPKPKVKAVASKKVKASGKVGKIKVSSKKSLV